LREIENEDLLKYGLIPEFVGRLPVIATLEDLTKQDLVRVLTEPKDAVIKQYACLLDMNGVKLHFTDEAIEAIAEKAIEKKTGARGLRSIAENLLTDVMYDIPDKTDVVEVVIDESVVSGKSKPMIIDEKFASVRCI
ncbi:MAG: ATP-dependent Clp protease ATP-binding subunit ClpX, partial [Holosporales bacterium]|nr:ATP-dependent Clp protease ATP-binding subunit ClpX [Holosporales bacterium]